MCKSFDDDKRFTMLNVLKENFVEIHKIIIDELNSLKISVNAQALRMEEQEKKIKDMEEKNLQKQTKIDSLEKNYDSLKLKMIMNELKTSACEAVYLFQSYFINPIIKEMGIDSWSQLTGT